MNEIISIDKYFDPSNKKWETVDAGNKAHIYDVVDTPVKELAAKEAIGCSHCQRW
ncbi:unnamed protein product [marine sediment metagenome]|uniref:Uncharacterized protein n=1 Tax=marine sediment metagenome TaxID=412755 RepID=X0RH53_9ZZZZ